MLDCVSTGIYGEERLEFTGWVREQETDDAEGFPFVDLGDVDQVDVDEEWQSPDLTESSSQREFTPYFGDICQRQHGNHVEYCGRDNEKIRVEGAESETF